LGAWAAVKSQENLINHEKAAGANPQIVAFNLRNVIGSLAAAKSRKNLINHEKAAGANPQIVAFNLK